MSSKKLLKKTSKESLANHNQKSSCRIGKSKSSHTNGKTKSNGNSRLGTPSKITVDRQPFVYEAWVRGKSYRDIAEMFSKEYEPIDHSTIFVFIKEYFEEAKKFREEFYANIKAIPIANAPVRIKELEDTRTKLKGAIDKIMVYEPRQWDTLNLASLVRELRGLTEQIQDEAGDKIQKVKGEGMASPIQIFNYMPGVLADVNGSERVSVKASGDRFSGN